MLFKALYIERFPLDSISISPPIVGLKIGTLYKKKLPKRTKRNYTIMSMGCFVTQNFIVKEGWLFERIIYKHDYTRFIYNLQLAEVRVAWGR